MTIDRTSRESKAISLMRFPLAVLIVLLHTGVTCGNEDVAYYLCNYISAPIVVCAVPTFFFISGYLFFMGRDFSRHQYTRKIKSKVKGLLMPYVLWNIIAYVFMVFSNYWIYHSIGDIMPWELYKILWANGEPIYLTSLLGYKYVALVGPALGVLWFMRDLMVMMVCTIFMYPIVKFLKWYLFPLLLIINVLGLGSPFPGFSLPAISFFYMGAFFRIQEINVFSWLNRYDRYVLTLWPLLIVARILMKWHSMSEPIGFNFLYLTSSVAFVFVASYKWSVRESVVQAKVNKWGESSFFIYTFTNIWIVWFINKEPGYMLDTIPYCGHTLNYLFLFSVRVLESLLVYYLMKRWTPNLLSVLTGKR